MASSQAVPFAPRWLRCAGCCLGLTFLPGACASPIWFGFTGWTIPAMLITAFVFLHSLSALLSGTAPPSPLRIIADVLGSRLVMESESSHSRRAPRIRPRRSPPPRRGG